MKKLTVEEKAKAYDEAVGVCRKMYNKAKANGYTALSEAYERIFPALKESEDENIRKAAIEFVRQNKSFHYSLGISKEQVLAWIEKQGEQKKTPIEGEFPYDNPSDTLEGEIENIWGKLSSGDRFSATKEGFREVITHFVNYIKEQNDRELVEQKSAWSEEDEEYINDLIGVFDGQQHQAHSDEEIVNWLKSLRHQKQWKPTKEQIMSLRWVLNHIPYDSHKEEINGLLEQLIKLYNYDENR